MKNIKKFIKTNREGDITFDSYAFENEVIKDVSAAKKRLSTKILDFTFDNVLSEVKDNITFYSLGFQTNFGWSYEKAYKFVKDTFKDIFEELNEERFKKIQALIDEQIKEIITDYNYRVQKALHYEVLFSYNNDMQEVIDPAIRAELKRRFPENKLLQYCFRDVDINIHYDFNEYDEVIIEQIAEEIKADVFSDKAIKEIVEFNNNISLRLATEAIINEVCGSPIADLSTSSILRDVDNIKLNRYFSDKSMKESKKLCEMCKKYDNLALDRFNVYLDHKIDFDYNETFNRICNKNSVKEGK